jgi:hypothetical protein
MCGCGCNDCGQQTLGNLKSPSWYKLPTTHYYYESDESAGPWYVGINPDPDDMIPSTKTTLTPAPTGTGGDIIMTATGTTGGNLPATDDGKILGLSPLMLLLVAGGAILLMSSSR